MRAIGERWIWVVFAASAPLAGCSGGLIDVVENGADGGNAVGLGTTEAAEDAGLGTTTEAANASSAEPECNLLSKCVPASHCVMKGAGPCGSDERLTCSSGRFYLFDSFPCTGLSCVEYDDGPQSCEEHCSCGSSGMSCEGSCPGAGRYSACSGGDCLVTLAAGGLVIGAIAADATDLYWMENNGSLLKTPLAGGATTKLWEGLAAGNIVLDDTSVYWTSRTGSTGTILRAPKTGGATTTLASGLGPEQSLAVDAVNLYAVGTSAVLQIPRSGGSVTTLAEGIFDSSGVAVNSTSVFYGSIVSHPGSNVTGYSIVSMPIGGGSVTTLFSSPTDPLSRVGIAATETHVYWPYAGNLFSVATTGGPRTTLATGHGISSAIVIDATSAYWPNFTPDVAPSVMAVALDGGSVVTLPAVGPSEFTTASPPFVATNDTGVFFGAAATHSIDNYQAIFELTPK